MTMQAIYDWIVANCQRVEMRLATFDFGALLVPQVIGKQAALGFHHEVQALVPIALDQHSPVGVIATQGRRHLEPARQPPSTTHWRCRTYRPYG